MSKYKNSRYPDKINGLIDNDGNINAEKVEASGIAVLTEAPTADNTDGDIKFVKLDSEPAERFAGYYYLIGSGESPKTLPVKGDIIVLDCGEEFGKVPFKVLSINGSIAKVFAIRETADKVKFNSSSVTDTFADGSTGQKYAGSTLDTYLNETWYNDLSAKIKAAIVPEVREQDMWWTSGEHEGPAYIMSYFSEWEQSNILTKKEGATLEIGSRNVYALSMQDIIDYLEKEDGATITEEELVSMFEAAGWNLLSSADADFSDLELIVDGTFGYVSKHYFKSGDRVRPALSLDLTKIVWN